MKVSLKNDKWIFKFNSVSISCSICKDNEFYNVTFILNNKMIKIVTKNLDKTFLSLEKYFNKKTNFNYR